ncbi:MAG: trehalase family glycosidase [Anaerolineales bacterium]
MTQYNFSMICDEIAGLWDHYINATPQDRDDHRLIGLPNPYVSPTPAGKGIFDQVQYYWDSYFIILGLVRQQRVPLARGMVDNFLHLFRRFGMIPPANRFYYTGISQPPLLTAMIEEVMAVAADPEWKEAAYGVAEQDYRSYWMQGRNDRNPVYHLVDEIGANRYCDVHLNHATAEDESGWDYTWRFEERCMDILPIDLNVFLYRYEKDFAAFYRHKGARGPAQAWEAAAARRKGTIQQHMWDEADGFYYDYDFVNRRRLRMKTLAGFTPLWAGLASAEQADRMMRNALPGFEHPWGLANTEAVHKQPFKQWDYPNGWPNMHWLVLDGMWRYGYTQEVRRVAEKWLSLNCLIRERTGAFWEKYDVVAGEVGKSAVYPTQQGFGWTLGVFVAMVQKFLQ